MRKITLAILLLSVTMCFSQEEPDWVKKINVLSEPQIEARAKRDAKIMKAFKKEGVYIDKILFVRYKKLYFPRREKNVYNLVTYEYNYIPRYGAVPVTRKEFRYVWYVQYIGKYGIEKHKLLDKKLKRVL